jgi:hypothetical protein
MVQREDKMEMNDLPNETQQYENPMLRLRRLVIDPNGKIKKQDAIEMGFELLISERNELIGYIKALKMLAIYLADRGHIQPEILSSEYFKKAEQHFPEHLRREIAIVIQE